MNIINAIYNLVHNCVISLSPCEQGRNRVNNVGDALEKYIKNLFADTFSMSEENRLKKWSKVFSYLGNSNNPPDVMLRGGDAIEVKKIESNTSSIALNSSFPKQVLRSCSTMISAACREAEQWSEKDMIYVVGVVEDDTLKQLSMVYGVDYCAKDECYGRIQKTIKTGIENIPDVEFAETRELGRVNKVDPLGITYMRVRGMWGIENPWRAFDYIYEMDSNKKFNFMCIINDEKWATFNNTVLLTSLDVDGFLIQDVEVKNPDNPARLVSAKLITYSIN